MTDPADASTTAGLVVDAVKVDAIDQFGTPDAVAAKVVAVETKKENSNSARVDSARAVQLVLGQGPHLLPPRLHRRLVARRQALRREGHRDGEAAVRPHRAGESR